MANTDLVLELLEFINPKAYCDDCLSNELGIKPRQQVNQICRRLEDNKRLSRDRGICKMCGKEKLVNSIISPGAENNGGLEFKIKLRTQTESLKANKVPFDFVKTRNEIVKIGRTIWKKTESSEPPKSISELICNLRNKDIIPSHQANMMLTLCNMRNCIVYESVEFSERENIIGENAWKIINDWLKNYEY